MDLVVTLFPWLIVLAALVLVVLAFRLDKRISRGARSAGPREVPHPEPVGLQQTPWELEALHEQVRVRRGTAARRELIHTVNRLTEAAGVTDPRFQLHPESGDDAVAAVILHLEQRMELPPLVETPRAQR
ncbi:MAG: hypothetical protein AAF531_11295 [Actinomycetota bacterium]